MLRRMLRTPESGRATLIRSGGAVCGVARRRAVYVVSVWSVRDEGTYSILLKNGNGLRHRSPVHRLQYIDALDSPLVEASQATHRSATVRRA